MIGSAFGILAMVWILSGAAIARTVDQIDQNAAVTLIPLQSDPQAADTAYLQTRCRDFVVAVRIVASIMHNNPVSGRDPGRRKALGWADRVNLNADFPLAEPDGDAHFVQAYLDAFGPLDVNVSEPQAAIYARDKRTCTAILRS